MSIRIRLHGEDYWLIADSLDEAGAVAPLWHCDHEGNVAEVFELSYAHYYPDEGVLRFHQKIADRTDIEIVSQ